MAILDNGKKKILTWLAVGAIAASAIAATACDDDEDEEPVDGTPVATETIAETPAAEDETPAAEDETPEAEDDGEETPEGE